MNRAPIATPRRREDSAADLWSTFNRIQENSVRGGVPGATPTGRRIRTRAISGIAENTRLNRALWTLAQRMAELVG